MSEFTPTTSTATSSSDEAAPPTARKRGRPTKPAASPPRAKAKAAKAPPKPKPPAKPPVRRTPNAAAVRPILKHMVAMNAAGTMTPEIAAAALQFCIVLLGDDLHV